MKDRRREHWTRLGWDLKQVKNGSSAKAHIRVDDIILSQGLRKMTQKAFGLVTFSSFFFNTFWACNL
jgi:hypothetical protein